MNDIFYIFSGLRPARWFASRQIQLRPALVGMGLLLLVCTLALVATAFLFGNETIKAGNYALRAGDVKIFRVSTPIERLFFPVIWLTYIGFATLIRHLTTAIYGETGRDIRAMLTVTTIAAAPLVLAAALQALLNNLFPVVGAAMEASPVLIGVRTLIALGLYGSALWFEARFCVIAFRKTMSQPGGRAVLTWLAPAHFVLLLLAFVIVAGWAT